MLKVEHSMTELEQVEQELINLRYRFKQSLEAFDALAHIQTQFKDLAETHQAFKSVIEEARTSHREDLEHFQKIVNQRLTGLEQAIATAQTETRKQIQESVDQRCTALEDAIAAFRTETPNHQLETINQRFASLEKLIESVRQEAQDQLMTIRNEATTADQNLSQSLAQRTQQLKQEMTEQFKGLRQEWADPKALLQESIQDFEERVRADLKVAIDRLNQNGFNAAHLERLDRLDTQLRALKSSTRSAEQRLQVTSNWLIAAMLTAVIALSFPVFLILSGQMNFFSSPEPTSNLNGQRDSAYRPVSTP